MTAAATSSAAKRPAPGATARWAVPIRDWLPSIACAVICATALFAPDYSMQTAVIFAGGVLALAAALLAWLGGFARTVPAAIWWLGLPVAVLAISALASDNPTVGMSGIFLSRRGASLWIVAWAWAATGATFASKHALSRMVRTLAILGAAASVIGLVQFSGIAESGYWWSAEPSAFFVDSNGFAQFLLIAAGCAASWLLTERTENPSWTATPVLVPAAVLALVVAGLATSQSRGAWVSAAAGCVIFAILTTQRFDRKQRTIALIACAAFVVVALAGAMTISHGSPGDSSAAFDALDSALNSRPTIWRSALAQIGQSPLLGTGHETFSTYYSWLPATDRVGGVNAIGTFDSHSALLTWTLAAGIPGLLALLAAAVFYIRALAERLVSGTGAPAAALLATIGAWSVTQTAEISGLVAAPLAAMLAGMVLAGMSPRPEPRRPWDLLPAGSVAAAGLVVVVLGFNVLGFERTFVNTEVTTQADVFEIVELHESSHDPRYLLITLDRLLAQSMTTYSPALATDAQMLATKLEPDASWNVNAARLSHTAWLLGSVVHTNGSAADARAALDAGREADPVTDLWDYLETQTP